MENRLLKAGAFASLCLASSIPAVMGYEALKLPPPHATVQSFGSVALKAGRDQADVFGSLLPHPSQVLNEHNKDILAGDGLLMIGPGMVIGGCLIGKEAFGKLDNIVKAEKSRRAQKAS